MDNLLEKIKQPSDIKLFSHVQLDALCSEIRAKIIDTVSKNGGHLASNLGVVELTVALHKVFDSPTDSIIFDVSHQCYTHKILTGRSESFSTLRTNGGITGFSNPDESQHDLYKNGHSSTSISAALGVASAKKIKGDTSYTIAVIGDGSLSSGLAYEGLNNSGHSNTKLIIVLNDNKMSISRNVGGISRHLTVIRSSKSYHTFKGRFEKSVLSIPFIGKKLRNFLFKSKKFLKNIFYNSNIFEDMGFNYFGPVDGHDLKALEKVLESSKIANRPAVVHVITKKGFGYYPAQSNPTAFHSTGEFDPNTGEYKQPADSFSSVFDNIITEFAKNDTRICAITAAMCDGTGLNTFKENFKDRYFDVGIAEEHAVTFSSGLSKGGMIPVFAVYSSFLQRAYDELIHDCALQKSQLILAIDRAGIVGMDGETHQGIFDIPFLTSIPNIQIYSPTSYDDLRKSFERATLYKDGISAIRFPRGKQPVVSKKYTSSLEDFDIFGSTDCKIAVISYGRVFANVANAVENGGNNNIKLIKLNKIFPIDFCKLKAELENVKKIIIFEESSFNGSISELILSNIDISTKAVTLPTEFIGQNDTDTILDNFGLSETKIYQLLIKECKS